MMRAPTRSSRHTPWSALTQATPTRPARVAVWVIASPADHVLHAALCLVGVALWLLLRGGAAAPVRTPGGGDRGALP
jgi:hypothetical protein